MIKNSLQLLILAVAWLLASDGWAANSADALIDKGIELRRQGNHSSALELFERAYALEPSPLAMAQRGLAEQPLKRWADSETHLLAALATPNDPWVAKNRVHLEFALSKVREHIGELVLTGSPAGAEVWVNGASRGKLPLGAPLRVGEGEVQMQVTAPGYQPLVSSTRVAGGGKAAVSVQLEQVRFVEVPPPGSRDAAGWWTPRRIVSSALIGGGVAASAVGIGLLARGGGSDCEQGFACISGSPSRAPGWALLGVGIGAAAAGGIVLFTAPSTRVELGLGPSMSVKGRF
jgi:hypothetical protein